MQYDTLKFIRTANADQLADIALRLAAVNEELFLAAVQDAGIVLTIRVIEVNGFAHKLDINGLQKLVDQAEVGNKVRSIKHAREIFGLGLKDAKDLVEHLMVEGTLKKIVAPMPTIVEVSGHLPGKSLGDLLREENERQLRQDDEDSRYYDYRDDDYRYDAAGNRY